MEKIAEVLDRKFLLFNTVPPTHSIKDALQQMCCENVEYLIVMQDDKFLGILTDHDITNKMLFTSQPLDDIPVKEFMNTYLPVVTLNDAIDDVMQLLERHNARYLVVFDSFDFKGVVSYFDLVQYSLRWPKELVKETVAEEKYAYTY